MKVLLSIKPEFASMIFDGTKKYEFRRAIFKNRDVDTVIVYASRPVGKVIGEFKIGNILHEEIPVLWSRTGEYSGTTEEKFRKYFSNKSKGYAIQVAEPILYDRARQLESLGVTSPPQSFMYV